MTAPPGNHEPAGPPAPATSAPAISPARPPRLTALKRLGVGLLGGVVVAALVATGLASGVRGIPWPLTAGRLAALAALALLMMQFVLSGRIRWLDRLFGLDWLYRLHARLGVLAVVLASLHPLLIYWVRPGPGPEDWPAAWPELLGAGMLSLLWLVLCVSLYRAFLRLPYGLWRRLHWLVFLVTAAALVHAFSLGRDFGHLWQVRLVWLLVALAYGAGFLWAKLGRRALLQRSSFQVRSVRRVNHNTLNIELMPIDGRPFSFLPGQFIFVRFGSGSVPPEEHPFTISSSPTRPDALSLTVRQCGDFTNRMRQLVPLQRARVHGPFGRFCHLLLARPAEPLVMIAGGVGITPLLSMLRYMADVGDERRVKLIWANRTEADIFFREELEALRRRLPGLSVHHVLSRQEDFDGLRGHIDVELLKRLLLAEGRRGRALVCGPPGMMKAARRALRKVGFPRWRIHTERFALM